MNALATIRVTPKSLIIPSEEQKKNICKIKHVKLIEGGGKGLFDQRRGFFVQAIGPINVSVASAGEFKGNLPTYLIYLIPTDPTNRFDPAMERTYYISSGDDMAIQIKEDLCE